MVKNALTEQIQLAISLQRKHQFSDAEKLYKKLLKLYSDNFEINFLLGFLYKQVRNFENSEIYLSKACKIKPSHSESKYNLGFVYEKLGNIKKALQLYKETLNINSQHLIAQLRLAECQSENGIKDEAKMNYCQIIEKDNNNSTAHWNYGTLLLKEGKHKKGLDHIKKGTGFVRFSHNSFEII